MDRERIDTALARLAAATQRVEAAGLALAEAPAVDPREHAGLQDRHAQLKDTVARSLRQLDEILTGLHADGTGTDGTGTGAMGRTT